MTTTPLLYPKDFMLIQEYYLIYSTFSTYSNWSGQFHWSCCSFPNTKSNQGSGSECGYPLSSVFFHLEHSPTSVCIYVYFDINNFIKFPILKTLITKIMHLGFHIILMIGHDPNSNYLIKIQKTKIFWNKQLAPLPHPKPKEVHYGFDIPCKELSRRVLPHLKIISH